MSSEKRSIDLTTVIVAVIGLVGTIAAALITVYATRPSDTPTQAPLTAVVFTSTVTDTPAPTDTVPPGEPTSTPAPTDTPMPEPTSTFTAIPRVPIGEDWSKDCISSLWEPYSSTGPVDAIEKDGCLSQPVMSFFAGNGRLSFLYEERLSSAAVQGLFAPLSVEGTASVKVSLRDLDTSDIWIGIFAEPTIDSQGLLMSIPAGKVGERPFVAWQMPGSKKITSTQFLNQGSGYGVKFEYNAGSVRAVVLPNVFATNTYPVSSSQKWLFIGYQAMNGNNRIDAWFFDLTIGN